MIEIVEILKQLETHILIFGGLSAISLAVIGLALMGIGQELKKMNRK